MELPEIPMRNKDSSKDVITRLESVYDYVLKKPIDERRAYNQTLALAVDDIDPAAVQAAAFKWIFSNTPFMPKPGELRAMALDIQAQAKDTVKLPDVATAYRQAQKYAAGIRMYRSYTETEGSRYHELRVKEDKTTELVPVDSFEESELYPKDIHPAVIDAAKVVGLNRIYEDGENAALFAQFRDTYGTIQKRDEQIAAVTHPLIAGAVSALSAKFRLKEGANERSQIAAASQVLDAT